MDAAPATSLSLTIRRTVRAAARGSLPRMDGPERTDQVVGASRVRFAVGGRGFESGRTLPSGHAQAARRQALLRDRRVPGKS